MPLDSLAPMDDITALSFPVEQVPLYTATRTVPNIRNPLDAMQEVPKDKWSAIVRTDTGQCLGVHGSRYKLRPFSDAVVALNEAIVQVVPAANRNNIEIKNEIYQGGAQLRRSITFKDLKIEPQKNDIVAFQIDHWDSYDGSWAEQNTLWSVRLWCLNGCTTNDFTVRHSVRHSSSDARVSEMKESLTRGIDAFFNSQDMFMRWTQKPVSQQAAEHVFKKTICATGNIKLPPEERYVPHTLGELSERFSREPRTVWGAYNAATNWATHFETKGQAQNVTRHRNSRVAEMLRSDEWLSISS